MSTIDHWHHEAIAGMAHELADSVANDRGPQGTHEYFTAYERAMFRAAQALVNTRRAKELVPAIRQIKQFVDERRDEVGYAIQEYREFDFQQIIDTAGDDDCSPHRNSHRQS